MKKENSDWTEESREISTQSGSQGKQERQEFSWSQGDKSGTSENTNFSIKIEPMETVQNKEKW